MKPETTNWEKLWKFRNMGKLNNAHINSQWVKAKIKRKMRKYLEMNENENTICQILWGIAKAVLIENYNCNYLYYEIDQ